MTIYEIDKQIYNLFDEETGELKDYEAFDKLNLERDTKIENIALYIKDLLGDAEKIKVEKDKLAERKKHCENRAESLKKLLDYALQGNTFKTEKTNITYRKSEKCIVSNEGEFIKLHPEYVAEEVKQKIQLNDIKKAIKLGETISGAEIIECNNIQIK